MLGMVVERVERALRNREDRRTRGAEDDSDAPASGTSERLRANPSKRFLILRDVGEG
jgi:hypothetical protein